MLFTQGMIQQSTLQAGKLYYVTKPDGIVSAWSHKSFVPIWNRHEGNLQESLRELISECLLIDNKQYILYCGSEEGYTNMDGNGLYLRFLYKKSLIFFSKTQLKGVTFNEIKSRK